MFIVSAMVPVRLTNEAMKPKRFAAKKVQGLFSHHTWVRKCYVIIYILNLWKTQGRLKNKLSLVFKWPNFTDVQRKLDFSVVGLWVLWLSWCDIGSLTGGTKTEPRNFWVTAQHFMCLFFKQTKKPARQTCLVFCQEYLK